MNNNKQKIKEDSNLDFDNLKDNFMSFNMEKIKDNGEDSDPLIIYQNKKIGLFVFDGLGGAGSKKVSIGETTKTLAFLASRKVRELTELYFKEVIDENFIVNEKLIDRFKNFLSENLNKYKNELKIEKSKIKSDLFKVLPTTISGMIICEDKTFKNKLIINNIWAGDSRNYSLTRQNGLVQLTIDDLKKQGDALKNLSSDSKMSNCISADESFRINHKQVSRIETPVILFSTTDGAFDYLPTPMHFEYLLLDSINQSTSFNDLKEKIISKLRDIVGDDVSMAFTYLGYPDYQSLKNDFADRLDSLKTFIEPLDDLTEKLEKENVELENIKKSISDKKQKISEMKENLWNEYSLEYNHLIINSNSEL